MHDDETSKTSCLLVEDSSTVRKAIKRFLKEYSFDIEEAENGQVGLDKCDEKVPDVIILDWNMPVMDGLTFLKHLRLKEKGHHPKVIFCTTENDLVHIQKALAHGADEYIMKPFDKDILREKLMLVGVI